MRALKVAAIAGVLLSLTVCVRLRCQVATDREAARGSGAPTTNATQKPTSTLLNQILKQIQGAESLKTVPPLEGMTRDEALAALERADLKGTFSNVEGHAGWHVAAQSPVSGTSVKAGSNVVVTLGPMVPTLIGLTVNVAMMKLDAANLQLGGQTTEGAASVVPLIARQTPEANTYALPDSGVSVWLPPQALAGKTNNPAATDATEAAGDGYTATVGRWFKMPSVLGLTFKKAESVMATVGVVPIASLGKTRGNVQDQSVAAGSPVQKGERVTLTMGIVVPDVEGLTPEAAQKQLAQVGLEGLYSANVSRVPGMSIMVVQQTPAPSSIATTNLNVMLFAKLSPGWQWWAGGAVGLLLVSLAIGKTVKVLSHPPTPEFRAEANRDTRTVTTRIAPSVAFELRTKRGEGEVEVLEAPRVKPVGVGGD